MKIINVAMNGLGSVNKTLSSILNDKREVLAQKYGLGFNIVMISDSSGVAYNGDGFDMNEIIIHQLGSEHLPALGATLAEDANHPNGRCKPSKT